MINFLFSDKTGKTRQDDYRASHPESPRSPLLLHRARAHRVLLEVHRAGGSLHQEQGGSTLWRRLHRDEQSQGRQGGAQVRQGNDGSKVPGGV